ncbi:uncharacterized protein [Ptychodera flava]|uniref:uncharacterized protein n=1 Tax=Ptychodera flava TaxID=63121 RepID=UPI00396A7518
MTQIKSKNSKLLDEIRPTSQRSTPGHQTSGLTKTAVNQKEFNDDGQAMQDPTIVEIEERQSGTLGVEVSTSYGNAANGTSMQDVEEEFDRHEGSRPINEGIGGVLTSPDRNLEVTKIDKGSLRYVMKCRSLDALEALWSEYMSGRLDKTIHSTIITPTLLSKIQAHYLTLDIYIPVQEYLLCKREIPLLTGSVSKPSRRHSVTAAAELQTVKSKDSTLSQTVESLSLMGPKIQIRDSKTSCDVLGRDDFRIKDLHHLRTTFATKHDKLWLDVKVEEIKYGLSKRTRDRLWTNRQTEISSLSREQDGAVSEFVQLKIHSSQYSSQRKAVLHEAGQKLMTQREFATSQATPVKEKFEATNEVYNEMQSDLERVNKGYPVKESVLEVFGEGSMPGQLNVAVGIYIKNNGQWVICDGDNHRVQVIDPIKLCCDLILQFHAFPNPFNPWNVTVDEDNDQYFMSDGGNGQVVVSSGQSKILNCFGRKEGIDPRGICLSPDGFIFIGDMNGYVRKYNKSGEHIARTEKGQVIQPWDLIVNKKWIFVSDGGIGRNCVHVLNHQMQSIRDIGKGHLKGQWVCVLITNKMAYMFVITME